MKNIERAYGKVLKGTFRAINPIKKGVIKTDCKVHIKIQSHSLDILRMYGYDKEYDFFNKYIKYINKGLVWADQDFKSYHHFYNPDIKKGMYGYSENALTLAQEYYDLAKSNFLDKNYETSMFYFGASCHLIQDLTIPQHAKVKLFDNHRPFELYVRNNYTKITSCKVNNKPIILHSVESFADYNSMHAIKVDKTYRHISHTESRFYLTAIKTVSTAHRSTAGYMIMFFDEINN